MPSRLSLHEVRLSRIPVTLGLCAEDLPSICSYINEAQKRLIEASGNEGWWGNYATMAFNVDPNDPFIVTPKEVARLEDIDVCRNPIRINNPWYEYLQFGCGVQRQPPSCSGAINRPNSGCKNPIQAYDRGVVVTMSELTPGNKLRIYMTNAADTTKRIFFEALDANGKPIYTMDRGVQVNGFFVTLDNLVPFVESPMSLNSISGVLKDVTVGAVQVYGVNPSTDEQTLIATYAPNETAPCYRKYFLSNLPSRCCDCDSPDNLIQVQAMAKLEFIPVASDTDFLLIQNIPALKEECQSIRYGEMDVANAKQMEELHHKRAIRLLNQELIHYLGKDRPALGWHPFGSSPLASIGVGVMT